MWNFWLVFKISLLKNQFNIKTNNVNNYKITIAVILIVIVIQQM